MIYHFSDYLKHYYSFFNVFHYVSVRAIIGLLSSFGVFLLLGNNFMNFAGRFFRSPVRELTPESHQKKNSMPTMGGIFILFVVIINILLWSDLSCSFVWIFMFGISGFGAIGFWDDWSKIHKRK